MEDKKNILFCVLNWGIGHATRSIPLIEKELEKGHRVILASDGAALDVLKNVFPLVPFEILPSYQITYPREFSLAWSLFFQTPKIFQTIRKEHLAVEKLIRKYEINYIISDSRFGCYSKKIPAVFITHQLNIQAPFLLKKIVDTINKKQIERFSECWIPDIEGEKSLAGNLTKSEIKIPIKYLGILSRFKGNIVAEKIYDIAVILSGPEPQRSYFEEKIKTELLKTKYNVIILGGNTNKQNTSSSTKNISYIPFSDAETTEKIIAQSSCVIARAGYSTIMDLAISQHKNSILIPTPEQTEQEYLATYLSKKGFCKTISQKEFSAEIIDKIISTL